MSSSQLLRSVGICAFLVFSSVTEAAPRLRAQDGANDPTFNVIDDGTYGDGTWSQVNTIALQPDGKVIVGGNFGSYNEASCIYMARLNVDGSFDPSFDVGAGPSSQFLTDIALQPDGKLITVGGFVSFDGEPRSRIARLNSDGSLDTTFQPGRAANSHVSAVALQPDGRMVIGGHFTAYDLVSRNFVARVASDGSLDTSFSSGAGPNAAVFAVAVQPDGRVLIAGQFTSVDGQPRRRIARLLPGGGLDASFGNSSGADASIHAITLQPDGKILIAGSFVTYDGVNRVAIARLFADGSLDTSFNPGAPSNGTLYDVKLLPNNQVLVCGNFLNFAGFVRHGLVRLNTNGSVDAAFVRADDYRVVTSFVAHPDGRATAVGYAGMTYPDFTFKNSVARMLPNGVIDPSFNPIKGANGVVADIALQPDGKAVIGGWFSSINAVPRGRVARLNSDGSLDVGYANGGVDDGRVDAVALQPDGKAVIAGNFSSCGGVPRESIARLHVDGTLDLGFDPGAGFDSGGVNALELQPDGRIFVAGDFTTYDGVPRSRIARLFADGSLDPSFDPGDGANDRVRDLALQPDGKLLLAGHFSWMGGVIRWRIARLHADGSLDTSFDPGTATHGVINSIALQTDGHIVIGASYGTFGGFARLRSNGSFDPSFATLSFSNETNIRRVLTQPDGKHIVLGNFTQVGGVPYNRIARLTENGRLDTSFDPGAGADSTVTAAALLPDGDLLIGGWFSHYDGAVRHRLARVHAAWEPGRAYCTAGTSTNGCTPSIGFSGSPHVSATSGFTIDVSNLEGQRQGLLFYGLSGRRADPWDFWSSSFMCVKSPTQRLSISNSGGAAGLCNGVLSTDWLAFVAVHPSALGKPFAAGTTVNAQAWYRDPPAPNASNLSDALEFVTTP